MLTPETVPALREELRLLPATPQPDGSPAWHVLDPVRNRFFRIGWLEFECLLRWSRADQRATPQAIAEDIAAHTPLAAEPPLFSACKNQATARLRASSRRNESRCSCRSISAAIDERPARSSAR